MTEELKKEILDILDNVYYWDTCPQEYNDRIDVVKKQLTVPVVMQSCDTCKHLSNCRFWQEAPNNGATCKFYIEHVA